MRRAAAPGALVQAAAEPVPRPSLAGRAAVREAGASYFDRSLDKTIIVRRGRATRLPGYPGRGTHYVFVPRH